MVASLLETKLDVPRVRPGVVVRPRQAGGRPAKRRAAPVRAGVNAPDSTRRTGPKSARKHVATEAATRWASTGTPVPGTFREFGR